MNLEYIVENQLFLVCHLMTADQFVGFCKDRGIQTSLDHLEQLEKQGLIYPIARIRKPKIKIKVEYSDDRSQYTVLEILQEDELWVGEIIEEFSHFQFEHGYSKEWLDNGYIWDPRDVPFQKWDSFYDISKGYKELFIESYYSLFQCYSLHIWQSQNTSTIGYEWLDGYNKDDFVNLFQNLKNIAEKSISSTKLSDFWKHVELTSNICQIISNRYYPRTQTDQRTIQVLSVGNDEDWWYKYQQQWSIQSFVKDQNTDIAILRELHSRIRHSAQYTDPLEAWYELVNFVSVEQKKKLKGKALLAQTFYQMEMMLRFLIEELSGEKLPLPNEDPSWKRENFYGEGVIENSLKYLELLTNRYHLNPKPKLILVVEGHGEYKHIPRLAKDLFGIDFSKASIEMYNLMGITNFEGDKKDKAKGGALLKFIDSYHSRQTIVFVILDNEGNVQQIKNKLTLTQSTLNPERKITTDSNIHIWNKDIESDNFSHKQIADALSKLAKSPNLFTEKDVTISFSKNKNLEQLFSLKKGSGWNKIELLGILFDSIKNSGDKTTIGNYPIVKVIEKVIRLANLNHQPITQRSYQKNQKSGYLG
jgi:hypothetical protein